MKTFKNCCVGLSLSVVFLISTNVKADLIQYDNASKAAQAGLTELLEISFSGQSSKLTANHDVIGSFTNDREVDLRLWIPIFFKAEDYYHHYNIGLDHSWLDDSWDIGGFTVEVSLNGMINGIVYTEKDVFDFGSVVVTEDTISFTTWCGMWRKDLIIPINFDPCINIKIKYWGCEKPEDSTAVPEPATLAVLGLGLAGLGLARRKRKKKE